METQEQRENEAVKDADDLVDLEESWWRGLLVRELDAHRHEENAVIDNTENVDLI